MALVPRITNYPDWPFPVTDRRMYGLVGVPIYTRGGAAGLVATIVRHSGIGRPVNPHLVRASTVTVLLDGGGDIREAQRLADHEDPRTTSRHYDLSKRNHDTHPAHIVSARLTV